MSANNLMHVFPHLIGDEKVKTKWCVEEQDAETGSTLNDLGDQFPTLEIAIGAANAYMEENEVEYGLQVDV